MKPDYYPGKRKLLEHTDKNCECWKCWRELFCLPPMETKEEEIASYRFEERAAKRARRDAKRSVKQGTQSTINTFFKKQKKGTIAVMHGLRDDDKENELRDEASI